MVPICLQCSHRRTLTPNFAFDGVLGFSVGFMIIAREKKSHGMPQLEAKLYKSPAVYTNSFVVTVWLNRKILLSLSITHQVFLLSVSAFN